MLVNGDTWEWVWDRFSSFSSVPALAAGADADAWRVYSLCDVINVLSVLVYNISYTTKWRVVSLLQSPKRVAAVHIHYHTF